MSLIQEILTEVENLIHFHPHSDTHQQAKANIEKIKVSGQLGPQEADAVTSLATAAVETHLPQAGGTAAEAEPETAPAEQQEAASGTAGEPSAAPPA